MVKYIDQEALEKFSKRKSWPAITMALTKVGQTQEAGDVITRLHRASEGRYLGLDAFAVAYLGAGDYSKVLECLVQACDEPNPQLAEDINGDPYWDPNQHDRRFVAILRKLGLERYSHIHDIS